MPKKSFRIKIIIPIVIVLVALVVTLNIFLSLRFSAIRDTLADEKHVANINSLYRYLATNEAASRAAAVSMAANPAVIRAIKERNTNELLLIFSRVQDLYWVNYYTICDSEGVALARTHDPGNFGDSVLNQQ
ncbi:MAG: hypothetical protein FWG46_01655, partial [Treponema sp.]|nr:hypothetical protein [Treponema sp.]